MNAGAFFYLVSRLWVSALKKGSPARMDACARRTRRARGPVEAGCRIPFKGTYPQPTHLI